MLNSLGTTAELAEIFSDHSVLAALLRFETALATVQARVGLIPQSAADAIARAATAGAFDTEALGRDARASATIVIPLVNALAARVHESDAASCRFVHWGATSQDVIDTAMVLLLGRAGDVLARDHDRLTRSLRELSDRHANTVMLARTLLQPALPITFGYKVAGWYAAIARSGRRVQGRFSEALKIQFGGAAGTLAAYGERGPALARDLAAELGLAAAPPWHSQRDRLAALAGSSGIYVGTLGKMARDIALLMQSEIGEVSEPGGGSSSMPHKRNPAGCVIALAAATRVPGLVASFLAAMVQEHERGAGGWQAEWPVLTDIVQSMGSALAAMRGVIEGLTVFPDRMRENVGKTPEKELGSAELFRKQLLEEEG